MNPANAAAMKSTTPRRLLMVAYHFPPLAGSSGIQRALRFVQHLPSFGWQPLVLSAHPRAYERTSPDQLADVPNIRLFARNLSDKQTVGVVSLTVDGFDPQELAAKPGQVLNVTLLRGAKKP